MAVGLRLPRVAVVMLLGHVGLLCAFGAAIFAMGSAALFVLPVGVVLWNVTTAAALPATVATNSIFHGFRTGVLALRLPRIWGIVLVQSILVGLVVVYSVSGTRIHHHGSTTTFSSKGTHVNGHWLGAYEDSLDRHDRVMVSGFNVAAWPPAAFLLLVLGAAFAIVVKVEVIRALRRANMLQA